MKRYTNSPPKKYGINQFLAIPFKVCPFSAMGMCWVRFFSALFPSISALIIAYVVDTFILIYNHEKKGNDLLIPILLYVGILFLNFVKDILVKNVFNIRLDFGVQKYVKVDLIEKQAKLKYRYIEDNDTWELLNRVTKNLEISITAGFTAILDIVELIVQIIATLLIICTQVWWAAVIILCISFFLIKLSIKSGQAIYESDKAAEVKRRRADYLKKIMIDRQNVEERSLFAYTAFIKKKWHEFYDLARKTSLKAELKWYIVGRSGGFLVLFLNILILFVLILAVADRRLSVGIFIGIYTPLTVLIDSITWKFTAVINDLVKHKQYIIDMSKMMALSEKDGAIDIPLESSDIVNSIEFKNVSFKYPGTEKYILKNVSFRMEKGKKYAFVGENGVGKTTIIKLITGLYEEYEGSIWVNKTELREIETAKLKSLFSVIYQDFAKFQLTIRENIKVGDIHNIHNKDDERIISLMNQIGNDEFIWEKKDSLNREVGKLKKESADLSGGQWQKLALARALYANHAVQIMDEPTASVDPISESKFYELFSSMSNDKLVILITHRLGAAKIADEIIVLENGTVCQMGSHEDLLANKGIYAQMYETQRSWYISDEKQD